MTVSWWTVYLLDQLSRRVSGNDKREGNQYYNVLLSLLKMGLMTGRASRTHTQPDSQCGHLCVCSSMAMQVCKIKSGTYFHPHNITHSEITHTGYKTYRVHTRWTLHDQSRHVLILRGYRFCFSMTQPALVELIIFLIFSVSLTFMLPLFSSKLHVLHRQAHQNSDFTCLLTWGQS